MPCHVARGERHRPAHTTQHPPQPAHAPQASTIMQFTLLLHHLSSQEGQEEWDHMSWHPQSTTVPRHATRPAPPPTHPHHHRSPALTITHHAFSNHHMALFTPVREGWEAYRCNCNCPTLPRRARRSLARRGTRPCSPFTAHLLTQPSCPSTHDISFLMSCMHMGDVAWGDVACDVACHSPRRAAHPSPHIPHTIPTPLHSHHALLLVPPLFPRPLHSGRGEGRGWLVPYPPTSVAPPPGPPPLPKPTPHPWHHHRHSPCPPLHATRRPPALHTLSQGQVGTRGRTREN